MPKTDPFSELQIAASIKEKISTHYSSIATLSRASIMELAEAAGISQKMARKIVSEARSLQESGPITAKELLEQFRNKYRLSTGSQRLDEILGGGIPTGSITELIGEFASGKTQLAFQLCINVQLPIAYGGLEGSAYFIDTEGTFSAKRLFEIARAKIEQFPDLPPVEKMLENIIVGRAYNSEHQINLIKEADKLIVDQNIKLIVIDSIAAHFRSEYIGKESLPARAQALMQHAAMIQRYAESYDMAIITTNQVLSSMDKFIGGQTAEPALGFAWGHRPQTRIFLQKQKGNIRLARLIDSSELPEADTTFQITDSGVSDGLFSFD